MKRVKKPRGTAPWNVLVFPGGTEIGLEVCSALKGCKEVSVISAGMDTSNHAPFVFPSHYILPSIHSPNWLAELNRLIAELSIDFVIPAYDDVILALASNADQIRATIVTSPLATCAIARSKRSTYSKLHSVVPCPAVFSTSDDIDFPVFAKPDRGQGSQGARLINSRQELERLADTDIALEYLPGEEFTVDCFSDRDRGLLFASGRKRVRVRNGISVATVAAHRPEFRRYAEAIASVLEFHGPWFFQVKEAADGTLKLLELAPRIAGAMAYHRCLGVNFPLLGVYEQAGYPVEIMINEDVDLELDRALINRYRHRLTFSVVYVDLDDTLLINGLVNPSLMGFLYQCLNSRIKIVLLTKCAGRLNEVLEQHRLTQVFDEVIHLASHQSKAEAITDDSSIFIDDSFAERAEVQKRRHIPTFDLSMVEMLIDHTGPSFHANTAEPRRFAHES